MKIILDYTSRISTPWRVTVSHRSEILYEQNADFAVEALELAKAYIKKHERRFDPFIVDLNWMPGSNNSIRENAT